MPSDDNMGYKADGESLFRYFNSNPTDATNVRVNDGIRLNQNLNSKLTLTKGLWKFTIGNPAGPVNNFTPLNDAVAFLDDNNNFQLKPYRVEAVAYNPITDKLEVTVDIKENPIPLFIIYGAVIGITAIIAAMSIDSVLEKVEQVIISVPKELGKSPFAWGIMLIFLIPVLVLAFKGKKKG